MTKTADWIAVDWGTTHLRVWVFGPGDEEIAHLTAEKGMGALVRGEYEAALLGLIAPYLADGVATQVIACGMVGARQGWAEAGYQTVPCPPPGIEAATRVATSDPRLDLWILPGLSQDHPPDVMRGEETQIAGVLSENPGFDGTLCLPGTHAKWVQISAGEIVSFRTVMTGELYAAISAHTVLRHSVGEADDEAAFLDGVQDGLMSPEALSVLMFRLRAESLLEGLSPGAAAARLSGLLIGLELAGTRGYWLGAEVAIVGGATLTAKYAAALRAQGLVPRVADGGAMALTGLRVARSSAVDDGGPK